MLNEDLKFDQRIRAIMEEGREEVPDHVWDSLSGKLDGIGSAKRESVLRIWFRKTAIAVSAAAAVTCGLVFSGIFRQEVPEDRIAVVPSESDLERPFKTAGIAKDEDSAKETQTQEGITAEMTAKAIQNKYIALAGETEDVNPAGTVPDAITREEESPAAEEKGPEAENSYNVNPDSFKNLDETDEFFGDINEGRTAHRVKTSLAIFGNAFSNSGNGKGDQALRPMKSPGFSLPQDNKIKETSESSYGIPLSFGIGARIQLAKRWSVGAGVNYTLLTRTFSGTYYRKNEAGAMEQTSYSDISNNLSYIGIPVNVYFDVIDSRFVNFYVYAGGTAEKCIGNRYIMRASQGHMTHKEKASGMQFSVNAGLGVEFALAEQLGLYIDPSVRYYFKGNQPKSIRTQQPLNIGLEVGLRIRL